MFFMFILVPINIKFDVMSLCDMFENRNISQMNFFDTRLPDKEFIHRPLFNYQRQFKDESKKQTSLRGGVIT